ncbi:MAG TPA: DUF177 domain-containing protein [Chitinispirillaceae bacterium]|nr:DUF177 domain-containing protein [Chitinispirillaceae bacterium]
MFLNLRVIPEGHSEISGTTELEALKADLPPVDRFVFYRAEIDRKSKDVYLHIWYEGVFELQCSRCLNTYKSKISGDFRLVLKELPGNLAQMSGDDSADFCFDRNQDVIDISAALYDEIMIAVPLKPLCSPDCKGVNISDKEIKIDYGDQIKTEEKIDPRWNELLKLKKRC